MAENRALALAELERRWCDIFATLQAGGEVAPARRLRTEGFMEALVVLGIASETALQEALERRYEQCFARPLPPDWRELFPFPQVPGFGRRAPVFPSTPD